MITNYKNKMQSPCLNKQIKFAQSSNSVKAAIKERYRQQKIAALQVGVKPVEWREWLEKEGYWTKTRMKSILKAKGGL